ncbi:uncharacterized protein LOC127855274 isoform X5 [Dreissena polymorpha]|uniref:uncharacterized protein LOC127855274 isoform X5 n=1 Tax=Dreissena polymorpha TaxID=45954 RepID=UPI002264922A|nr:uncharacterized protein LOC127855274 isoform X5 [Dreissena polymorpha]
MGEQNVSQQQILQQWIKFVHIRRLSSIDMGGPIHWNILCPRHAKQSDSISCGVYVLKNQSLEFVLSKTQLLEERRRIARRLLSEGEFIGGHLEEIASSPSVEHENSDQLANTPASAMELEGGDTDPVVDHVATTRNSDQLANTPASAMELEGGDTDPVVDHVATTRESRYPARASTSKVCGRHYLLTYQRGMYLALPSHQNMHLFAESPLFIINLRVRETHCLCNMPDDGREYWQCEGCFKWFHPECVGESVEPEKYKCASCSHK